MRRRRRLRTSHSVPLQAGTSSETAAITSDPALKDGGEYLGRGRRGDLREYICRDQKRGGGDGGERERGGGDRGGVSGKGGGWGVWGWWGRGG